MARLWHWQVNESGTYEGRLIRDQAAVTAVLYRPRVLGQWFDGIRIYAAFATPTRSRRTWAGLR